MKRSVQILLIASFIVPLPGLARDETMEERKQRIMRKYLRERTNIVQGDAEVPFDAPGDESVADSERFKEPQVDLRQRQESEMQMPPPPIPQRPRPPVEDRDWLLATDPLLDDPYADPFSRAEDSSEKKKDWSTREPELESPPFGGVQDDSLYDRWSQGSEQIQSRDPRRGELNTRDPRSFSSQGNQPGFRQQESITGGSPGIFGRQQKDPSGYAAGELDLSRDKTFNSTLNQSRLKSPFPRDSAPSSGQSLGSGPTQMKSQGYIPYKSPYRTQGNHQQQWGSRDQPEQEYKRQDSFQKWKDKNPPHFDPMRDDAYIDELMPKGGR
jgi:hypothetical protein